MEKNCKNCRYGEKSGPWYKCKASNPRHTEDGSSLFPIVGATEWCGAFIAKSSGGSARASRQASERSDLMGRLNGAENTMNGMKMEIEGLRAARRDAETETVLIRNSLAPLIEFLNNSEYKQPTLQVGELAVQVIKQLEADNAELEQQVENSGVMARVGSNTFNKIFSENERMSLCLSNIHNIAITTDMLKTSPKEFQDSIIRALFVKPSGGKS